jgi:site-specific DNA-methyltransferase (adenine-specific)
MTKYKIIYADPAWVYNDKSKSHGGGAESHYNCTPTEEMGKIPIDAADDSVLLMWVTYPQLEEGLKLMKLWGFTFKTVAFTWVKKNSKTEGFFFGMGRYTRSNPELVLLGIKGKGIQRISTNIKNLQIHKRTEHSKKPIEIKNEIVRLFGDLPRIELFARERTDGWDSWGDQLPNTIQKHVVEG